MIGWRPGWCWPGPVAPSSWWIRAWRLGSPTTGPSTWAETDSATSKTRSLAVAALELAGGGRLVDLIQLPADALLGRRPDAGVEDAVAAASAASVLVLATPIYRATCNGTIKAFFDRFSPDALSRTAVVWVGTAAAAGHFLALDTGGRCPHPGQGAEFVGRP